MKPRRALFLAALLAVSFTGLWYRTPLQVWAYGVGGAREHIGRPVPELPASIKALQGSRLRLAELRGRVVLLHFWTFGCGNCEHMVPHYSDWEQRLGAKGLTVVGVHTPETPAERDVERLRAFVQKKNIRWRVLVDPVYEAWDLYRIEAWPTVLLIDRVGTLRAVFVGDSQSREIEQALGTLLGS